MHTVMDYDKDLIHENLTKDIIVICFVLLFGIIYYLTFVLLCSHLLS